MKCEVKFFIRKAKPIVLLTNALCVDSWAIVGEWDGRPRGETFSSRQTLNCGNRHERAGWDGKAGSLLTARNWAQTLFGANLNLGVGYRPPHTRDPDGKRNMQYSILFWFPLLTHNFHVQHRFSAFWLRSKCSICSYQLNIWYGGHVPPSILNWFLQGDEVQELAPASSRVGLALQYRQDRPTSPLRPRDPHHHQQNWTIFHHNKGNMSSPSSIELNPSQVSTYLRIKKRATRSRRYLYFVAILKQICRADNQKWIITYIKETHRKEFGAQ